MKSPFTGGPIELHTEERSLDFRKEKFKIQYQFYVCLDSKESFTNDQLDDVNTKQVYHQYREKYGIPFPEEIKEIREQYGLPANKMSSILGLGINVYRNYEAGEVPNVSNGRMIQLIKDPKEFLELIQLGKNEFTSEELEKINKKITLAIEKHSFKETLEESIMLGEKKPGIFNGYRVRNIDKINNMILFFAEISKPYKTKLNKLLFYADFFHFRTSCHSISGLCYKAIPKGPVPKNYDWIFENTQEKKMVNIEYKDFGETIGERFVKHPAASFKKELFSESEMNTMKMIADAFQKDTVNQIVNKSHEEKAWQDNFVSYKMINYKYGFELKYPISDGFKNEK